MLTWSSFFPILSCGIESKFPSFLYCFPLPVSLTLVICYYDYELIPPSPHSPFSSSHSPPPYDCLATRIKSKDGLLHTKQLPQGSCLEDELSKVAWLKIPTICYSLSKA